MNQQLIQTLTNCARICEMCAASCLSENDVKMLTKCIKLDLDCAEICKTTATLLQRDSEVSDSILNIYVEICRKCAEECEKHASKMNHCKECAEACRRCEQECLAEV
jgi:hypothetical protein